MIRELAQGEEVLKLPYKEASIKDEEIALAVQLRGTKGYEGILNLNDPSIRVMQPSVFKKRVIALMKLKDWSKISDLPEVAKVGDKKIVIDGHHRLMAAFLMKKKSIKVTFVR